MNQPETQTIEQILYDRTGMSVTDAVATGTDVVDETAARAADAGIEIDTRLSELGRLVEKLTEPSTLSALSQLLEALPALAQLADLARHGPEFLATLADVFDDYQQQCAANGIDVEKALTNGIQAVLYLASQVEMDHLRRVGKLLASDILNPHALNVVDNAAKSLNNAQERVCGVQSDRIGLLGMLKALRDPQLQRSLAFVVQFGKCFGNNLDNNTNEN